jgi:signal transduction histidine kinase
MKLEKVKNTLIEKIRDFEATITYDFRTAPTCHAIPAYIESIFYNLLSNALKYRSPERKPIILFTSSQTDDKLYIRVEDNGIGMDADRHRGKLFTLYQRFHDHVEGKGMGLYLVKTQVEALNGTIDVESTVGKGTVFTIIIPNIN